MADNAHPPIPARPLPPDWPEKSARIRFERAGSRCKQCRDQETAQNSKEHSYPHAI